MSKEGLSTKANEGLSSKQTVIIAIFAVVGALIIGTLLFLSDVDAYLLERGR
jgi:hypothetical protein